MDGLDQALGLRQLSAGCTLIGRFEDAKYYNAQHSGPLDGCEHKQRSGSGATSQIHVSRFHWLVILAHFLRCKTEQACHVLLGLIKAAHPLDRWTRHCIWPEKHARARSPAAAALAAFDVACMASRVSTPADTLVALWLFTHSRWV